MLRSWFTSAQNTKTYATTTNSDPSPFKGEAVEMDQQCLEENKNSQEEEEGHEGQFERLDCETS